MTAQRDGRLTGKRIAFVATDGVEQAELDEPWRAVQEAGAEPELISIKSGEIQAFQHLDKGDTRKVDRLVKDANPDDYDALVLPGGVVNGDVIRMDADAVEFTRAFITAGKPVGSICHGPWTLIEAEAVRGRTVTSWPSLKTDLRNAGATWVDEQVVTDNGIVTSRHPGDLPAFNAKLVEEIAEGVHRSRKAASV
jgi:protease I